MLLQICFKKSLLLISGLFLFLFPTKSQISFDDVTEKAGLIEPLKGMMGHCAAWGDVNGDGFPDLFLAPFLTGRTVYTTCGGIQEDRKLIRSFTARVKETTGKLRTARCKLQADAPVQLLLIWTMTVILI